MKTIKTVTWRPQCCNSFLSLLAFPAEKDFVSHRVPALGQHIHKDISGLSILSWLVTPFKIHSADQPRFRRELAIGDLFAIQFLVINQVLPGPYCTLYEANQRRRVICNLDICHCCSYLSLGRGDTQIARLDAEEQSIG